MTEIAPGRPQAFASFNGPDFYGRPRNTGRVTLAREAWAVPEEYRFGDATIVPFMAGGSVPWTVQAL